MLKKIKKNLKSNINIHLMDIYDDSTSHNHSENCLTHLIITIISDDFIKKNWVTRHRIIFKILKKTVKNKIYSITLNTYTIIEWKNKHDNKIGKIPCFKKIR
ncbi:DNA-binding transcriptional regulator BolA [Buchnera aphidicola (Cavariella theobaldi)]